MVDFKARARSGGKLFLGLGSGSQHKATTAGAEGVNDIAGHE